MKSVHCEHFLPLLGVLWYLNCAFEAFASAVVV